MQPNTPDSAIQWRVRGRVQGVGFRWWCVRTATRLGLRGTVCNLSDGSVEVVAAGEGQALRELEILLERGPPGARVDSVRALPVSRRIPNDFRVVI